MPLVYGLYLHLMAVVAVLTAIPTVLLPLIRNARHFHLIQFKGCPIRVRVFHNCCICERYCGDIMPCYIVATNTTSLGHVFRVQNVSAMLFSDKINSCLQLVAVMHVLPHVFWYIYCTWMNTRFVVFEHL